MDGPQRILIIDTDNVRRGMLAVTLPTGRYALEFARTVAAGLDKLQQEVPDVILIGHDAESRDLCQHIRSLPTAHDCTVMLIDETFHDEAAGAAEAEASGADLAIHFPFTADEFEARLTLRSARASTAVPAPLEAQRAPLVDQSAPSAKTTDEPQPALVVDEQDAWAAFRGRIAGISERLPELDYYDLLEVSHQANSSEIKDSYFERSIEFHPDRFMQLDDAALKQQIYEVYKRITEAFKVLLDPEARAEYDRQLAGDGMGRLRYLEFGRSRDVAPASAELATTPASRKYVNFAELAERNGNLKSARMYLTLATQCEPRNTALRDRLDALTGKLSR